MLAHPRKSAFSSSIYGSNSCHRRRLNNDTARSCQSGPRRKVGYRRCQMRLRSARVFTWIRWNTKCKLVPQLCRNCCEAPPLVPTVHPPGKGGGGELLNDGRSSVATSDPRQPTYFTFPPCEDSRWKRRTAQSFLLSPGHVAHRVRTSCQDRTLSRLSGRFHRLMMNGRFVFGNEQGSQQK